MTSITSLSILPNPFFFAGPLADDEVENAAAIGQAAASFSTSESGLDERTFISVAGGIAHALAREIRRQRGAA